MELFFAKESRLGLVKIIHEEPQSIGKQSGYYANWNVKNTLKWKWPGE